MATNYRISAALLAVALVLGLWVFFHQEDLARAPWDDRLPLLFPFSTAIDNSGRMYVIDSGTTRLMAIDRDGTLRWVKTGGQREEGLFNGYLLDTDSGENLYVSNWVPYVGQQAVIEKAQIQKYDRDGRFLEVVFELRNPGWDESFPGHFSFSVEDQRLQIIHGDNNGYELFSTEGGVVSLRRRLSAAADFVSIAAAADGSLAAVGRDGSVWQAGPAEDWKPMASGALVKPWDVKFLPDGSLLVMDLGPGEIFHRAEDGSLRSVLDGKSTGGTLADRFSVGEDGTVIVSDREKMSLLTAQPGQGASVIDGARFRFLDRLGQALTWLALLAAGGCLLWLLARAFRRFVLDQDALPLALALAVLPVFLGLQFFVAVRIGEALEEQLRGDLRGMLEEGAQLVAATVDPVDLAKLNKPSDLGSPAYQRVREKIMELMRAGTTSGALSYFALYGRQGSRVVYLMTRSGTFGIAYPYPGFPVSQRQLFDRSGVGFEEYSDDYGTYFGGFASLKGLAGKPAGVVEVGLFAEPFAEKLTKVRGEVVQRSLWGTLAFSLVFGALTWGLYRARAGRRSILRELANKTWPVSNDLQRLLYRWEPTLGRGPVGEEVAQAAAAERFVPRGLLELTARGSRQILTVLVAETDRLKSPRSIDLAVAERLANDYGGIIAQTEPGGFVGLWPGDSSQGFEFGLDFLRQCGGAQGRLWRLGLYRGEVNLSTSAILLGHNNPARTLCRLCRELELGFLATGGSLSLVQQMQCRAAGSLPAFEDFPETPVFHPLDARFSSQAELLDFVRAHENAVSTPENWDDLVRRFPEDKLLQRLRQQNQAGGRV